MNIIEYNENKLTIDYTCSRSVKTQEIYVFLESNNINLENVKHLKIIEFKQHKSINEIISKCNMLQILEIESIDMINYAKKINYLNTIILKIKQTDKNIEKILEFLKRHNKIKEININLNEWKYTFINDIFEILQKLEKIYINQQMDNYLLDKIAKMKNLKYMDILYLQNFDLQILKKIIQRITIRKIIFDAIELNDIEIISTINVEYLHMKYFNDDMIVKYLEKITQNKNIKRIKVGCEKRHDDKYTFAIYWELLKIYEFLEIESKNETINKISKINNMLRKIKFNNKKYMCEFENQTKILLKCLKYKKIKLPKYLLWMIINESNMIHLNENKQTLFMC
jgi:hypothetical protein